MQKVVFETYEERRAHYMAAAHDLLIDKVAAKLKSVDTDKLFGHEPLDDWRYLLLAKTAIDVLQGEAYSK
jgi:hypothetical protein